MSRKPPLNWIKRAGTSAPSIDHVLGDALGRRGLIVGDPLATHSHGFRPHPKGIARQLLGLLDDKPAEAAKPPKDDRPLIDKVHEATFGDPVGLQWVKDKYALRGLLRKAHCFTLDADTSALIAEFSVAIAQDLDAARRLALPPFPVTWFDIDNRARLLRVKELGVSLTNNAEFDPVSRVGWLITPHPIFEYCATYFTEGNFGVVSLPLSYGWHTRAPTSAEQDLKYGAGTRTVNAALAFGVEGDSGVSPADASIYPASFGDDVDKFINVFDEQSGSQQAALMMEMAGELRHIWGLLIALGAGHLGAETTMTPQPAYAGPRVMAKGKELLPLEHKTLTIKLHKRKTAKVVAAQAIFHARKRWHEVRGHWREYKNPDGSVRKRVPVKPHERGDKHLGVIEKTYKVEK